MCTYTFLKLASFSTSCHARHVLLLCACTVLADWVCTAWAMLVWWICNAKNEGGGLFLLASIFVPSQKLYTLHKCWLASFSCFIVWESPGNLIQLQTAQGSELPRSWQATFLPGNSSEHHPWNSSHRLGAPCCCKVSSARQFNSFLS